MPFDFSPLTSTHLLLFGSGFAVVYGLLAIGRKYLRPAKPRIYFAGSILVGTTATLAVAAEGITKLTIGLLGVSIICLIVGLADEERPLTPAVQ